ncbi:uncharacterized protein CTRU02_213985 [Colletotrichum truncatum]|uniref:Uncharacterized protein n=1 Tax=Colletotrichum truncatum TaxID=5467 RepID=A0ACC3YH90_COLTU|nr:uncharacterized protein CTRU02_06298 [Colletotrichum truncatum]KAF6792802.1 hypothetical protein CTRU02_06298 [Colletotrichum truncatum]
MSNGNKQTMTQALLSESAKKRTSMTRIEFADVLAQIGEEATVILETPKLVQPSVQHSLEDMIITTLVLRRNTEKLLQNAQSMNKEIKAAIEKARETNKDDVDGGAKPANGNSAE